MLVDNSGFDIEHSIENQLQFLQKLLEKHEQQMVAMNVHGHVQKDDLQKIADTARKLAAILSETAKTGERGRRNMLVHGGTDYTHASPGHRELLLQPSSSSSRKVTTADYIRKQDQSFLSVLCDEKAPTKLLAARHAFPSLCNLWEHGRRISMCGLGVTLLVSEIAKFCDNARPMRHAVGSNICDRGLEEQAGFAQASFESLQVSYKAANKLLSRHAGSAELEALVCTRALCHERLNENSS